MNILKFAVISLACAVVPAIAYADPCVPLTGADPTYTGAIAGAGTNCNTIITIGAGNSVVITYPNLHPYDGSEDNYVGVVNNSGAAISSLSLSSTTDIFGFDGDGIDDFGIPGNPTDVTNEGFGTNAAYGGPNAFFTNISSNAQSGTVNFITPIADGQTGYFSLEEAPSSGSGITGTVGTTGVTPEPSTLVLLGTGVLGAAASIRRRFLRS